MSGLQSGRTVGRSVLRDYGTTEIVLQSDKNNVSVEVCRSLHVIDEIVRHRKADKRINQLSARGHMAEIIVELLELD